MEEMQRSEDILRAGTGFMLSLSECLHWLEKAGYTENLTAKTDHFECCIGKYKIMPKDMVIDKVVRFENSSDPDDQAILYAISAPSLGIKGVFVEGYGVNQDELSPELYEKLQQHRNLS